MASVAPSKKWEIPARPKPGRKPLNSSAHNGTVPTGGGGAADSKSSQKAHRERKANYIAELEAKVRAYEVEDGSKAVFFQRVAQKLKLENDTLRALVQSLRDELAKRPASDLCASPASPPTTRASSSSGGHKRSRATSEDQPQQVDSNKKPRLSEPASSPEFSKDLSPFDEDEHEPQPSPAASETLPTPAAGPPLSSISTLLSASEHEDSFFACGMCTSGTDGCACRDPLVALKVPQVMEQQHKLYQHQHVDESRPQQAHSAVVSKLPITLKKKGGPSVWRLDAAAAPAPNTAAAPSCSGNPANCPACADDKQGQEFCRSLRSSVPPPRRRSSTLTGSSLRSEPTTPSTDELPAPAEKPIYCSDAWMELRAHPNIASANLNMLAELVSHDATSVVQRPAPSAAVESSQAAPKAPSDGPSLEEQEWRRRLIIKRKGLDEAIKMLDSKTA